MSHLYPKIKRFCQPDFRRVSAFFCAVILSTGPVCMAYLTATSPLPLSICWLILPMALLTIGCILLTEYVLIPRFLVRDRFVAFAILIFLTAFTTDILSLFVEYFFRKATGLTRDVVFDPFIFWTYVDEFISSILLVYLLAGFSLWTIFNDYQRQETEEGKLRQWVEERSRQFRQSINMKRVRGMLNNAIECIGTDTQEAEHCIRSLSDYLRTSIYTDRREFLLPHPSRALSFPLSSKAVKFITERRYRWQRHLCLLLSFAILGCGLFFDLPYKPVLSLYNAMGALMLFLFLTLLSYLNIYLIFPKFLRRGRQKKYTRNLFIILTVVFVVLLIQSFAGRGYHNPAELLMPWFVIPIALAGNFLTFIFLFAGTSSLLLVKENLKGRWRLCRLETELSRLEFEGLQAQVNPHFLFNVLNNACILSYDNPEAARATLESVREFLEYMIEETDRRETSVSREAEFLTNYLTMEKSSGRQLDFKVNCDGSVRDSKIPVLLLIPLVENAAKHSEVVDGRREIDISISRIDGLVEFRCSNTCRNDASQSSSYPRLPSAEESSGLGLFNTRRRLQLLYGDNFQFETVRKGNIYSVRLLFPPYTEKQTEL